MKHILLLGIFSLILFSQAKASDLFLKINKYGTYKVKVSGETVFSSSKQYRFFDLPFGYHQVTVIDTCTRQVVNQVTILLKNNLRTVIELDAYGNFNTVAEIQVFKPNWYAENSTGNDPNYGNNHGNNNGNNNNNGNGNNGNNNNSGNNNNNGNWNNGNNNNVPGVNPTTFNQILDYVKADAFDSGRLARAKEVTKSNSLSAQQVADLTALLTYEKSKIDFAKFAYAYTADKGNYFLVYKTFSFSSSADEVRKFIQG